MTNKDNSIVREFQENYPQKAITHPFVDYFSIYKPERRVLNDSLESNHDKSNNALDDKKDEERVDDSSQSITEEEIREYPETTYSEEKNFKQYELSSLSAFKVIKNPFDIQRTTNRGSPRRELEMEKKTKEELIIKQRKEKEKMKILEMKIERKSEERSSDCADTKIIGKKVDTSLETENDKIQKSLEKIKRFEKIKKDRTKDEFIQTAQNTTVENMCTKIEELKNSEITKTESFEKTVEAVGTKTGDTVVFAENIEPKKEIKMEIEEPKIGQQEVSNNILVGTKTKEETPTIVEKEKQKMEEEKITNVQENLKTEKIEKEEKNEMMEIEMAVGTTPENDENKMEEDEIIDDTNFVVDEFDEPVKRSPKRKSKKAEKVVKNEKTKSDGSKNPRKKTQKRKPKKVAQHDENENGDDYESDEPKRILRKRKRTKKSKRYFTEEDSNDISEERSVESDNSEIEKLEERETSDSENEEESEGRGTKPIYKAQTKEETQRNKTKKLKKKKKEKAVPFIDDREEIDEIDNEASDQSNEEESSDDENDEMSNVYEMSENEKCENNEDENSMSNVFEESDVDENENNERIEDMEIDEDEMEERKEMEEKEQIDKKDDKSDEELEQAPIVFPKNKKKKRTLIMPWNPHQNDEVENEESDDNDEFQEKPLKSRLRKRPSKRG